MKIALIQNKVGGVMKNIRAGLVGLALLLCAAAATAAEPASAGAGAVHPGKALYEKHCSACHDKPDLTRAVPFAQLKNCLLYTSPSPRD